MLSGLYRPGDTPVHRCPALPKILTLIGFGTLVFLFSSAWTVLAASALVLALYALAGLGPGTVWETLRPVIWLLLAIFLVHCWTHDPGHALLVIARFAVLILAASLVTLTTRSGELIDGLQQGLGRFRRWLPVARISLAIALALRFIPIIQGIVLEVRQAQQARGLSGRPLALVVPVIIRTLRMADQIAEAIAARGFEDEPELEPDAVPIRGHHLLCLLSYAGRGYSAAFEANYERVIGMIQGGGPIVLHDGPDAICEPLRADAEHHCHDAATQQRDTAALAEIGAVLGRRLHPGQQLRLDAGEVARLREQFAAGRVRGACEGCQWRRLCDRIARRGFREARLGGAR